MMTDYGYGRVSTDRQDLEAQQAALLRYGVAPEFIEVEKITSRKAQRPGLERVLAELSRGDRLHCVKLDRLGRSMHELTDLAASLDERGVTLVIGGVPHDPTTATGRLLFNALAMVAEFERDMTAERTKDRLAHKKAKGESVGRPSALSVRQKAEAVKAHEAGLSKVRIAKIYGVARATVSKAIEAAKDDAAIAADPELRKQVRLLLQEERALVRRLEEATAIARIEKDAKRQEKSDG
ncbi:recombinase family protein [Curtobacterium sp. MCLR17_032]|uniref:recombinase family protein n=1 Tax=Curtobacterium sp. MCLR17_032 TaxID=2175650 RepID=UPI0015E89C8F|nr:recombinase family protein [Curtobacterium sp. MCLR17_032]WIE60957.1 recombinase family protein [Curtobacterium sp. MCLR17_032]